IRAFTRSVFIATIRVAVAAVNETTDGVKAEATALPKAPVTGTVPEMDTAPPACSGVPSVVLMVDNLAQSPLSNAMTDQELVESVAAASAMVPCAALIAARLPPVSRA